ncbi:MAG: hypothetical protein PSX79_05480 [bacterium]|nr:hypothetical protein [bacterium]
MAPTLIKAVSQPCHPIGRTPIPKVLGPNQPDFMIASANREEGGGAMKNREDVSIHSNLV